MLIALLTALLAAPAAAAGKAAPLGTVYVRAPDYPAGVPLNETPLGLTAAYRIGRDGAVSACGVTQTSGNARLDEASCRILVERLRLPQASGSTGEIRFRWMGTRTQSAPGAPGDALAISPDVWIGKGDYPRSAAMRGHQGQVIFAVEVSSRGEVRGCTITVSSGFESLDRRTCQVVMRNASFLPASDGAGGPRDGRYLGQFLWRLADGTPLPARTRPLVLLH